MHPVSIMAVNDMALATAACTTDFQTDPVVVTHAFDDNKAITEYPTLISLYTRTKCTVNILIIIHFVLQLISFFFLVCRMTGIHFHRAIEFQNSRRDEGLVTGAN
jgi:hypothetical protein